MSFDPIASPVDFIVLSGKRSPGIATLSGAALSRVIDERKGFGSIGATTLVRGQELAKFTVKIALSTPEDFAAWPEFAAHAKRNPRSDAAGNRTGRIQPFDIAHPILEDLGIRSVVVKAFHQPEATTDDGQWSYPIDFIEYKRRAPGLATTDGSTTDTSEDPYDREIERLTAQVERLAAAE